MTSPKPCPRSWNAAGAPNPLSSASTRVPAPGVPTPYMEFMATDEEGRERRERSLHFHSTWRTVGEPDDKGMVQMMQYEVSYPASTLVFVPSAVKAAEATIGSDGKLRADEPEGWRGCWVENEHALSRLLSPADMGALVSTDPVVTRGRRSENSGVTDVFWTWGGATLRVAHGAEHWARLRALVGLTLAESFEAHPDHLFEPQPQEK